MRNLSHLNHHELNYTLHALAGLNHSSVDLGSLRSLPQPCWYAVLIDTVNLHDLNDDIEVMRAQGYRIFRNEHNEYFCVSPAYAPAYPKHAGRIVKLENVPYSWIEITQPVH